MNKRWEDEAWEDYLSWHEKNKQMWKKINELIKDIERNGVSKGIGKPEKLRYKDGWSRRIDDKNRLIYKTDAQGYLYIISCKGHYE